MSYFLVVWLGFCIALVLWLSFVNGEIVIRKRRMIKRYGKTNYEWLRKYTQEKER